MITDDEWIAKRYVRSTAPRGAGFRYCHRLGARLQAQPYGDTVSWFLGGKPVRKAIDDPSMTGRWVVYDANGSPTDEFGSYGDALEALNTHLRRAI